MARDRTFQTLEIDKVDIAVTELAPHGMIRIDWFDPDWGFGQCDFVLEEDGTLSACTEHMDRGTDKAFCEALFRVLLDKVVIKQ